MKRNEDRSVSTLAAPITKISMTSALLSFNIITRQNQDRRVTMSLISSRTSQTTRKVAK